MEIVKEIKQQSKKSSNYIKNSTKELTCIKFNDYIQLIYYIGGGVMLQAHMVCFMSKLKGYSPQIVYRHLKELQANDIINLEKHHKNNLITLKKYGHRYIKQLEKGIELQSKDIGDYKITESKIERSIWVCSMLSNSKLEVYKTIEYFIQHLKDNTTFILRRSEGVECFNKLRDIQISPKAKTQVQDEIDYLNDKINTNKEHLKNVSKNKIVKEKIKHELVNEDTPKLKLTAKEKEDEKNRKFNPYTMISKGLYISHISNTEIKVIFFSKKSVSAATINYLHKRLYEYFIVKLLSYIDEGSLRVDLYINLICIVDNEGQTKITKKNYIEFYNTTYKEPADNVYHEKLLTNIKLYTKALDVSNKYFGGVTFE